MCRRDGRAYVAAVYFPPTTQHFAQVKSKYEADYEGVGRNGADSFIFLTNQRLSVGHRAELLSSGTAHDQVYHLERILGVLNSPLGYGLRLEYLGIPMTAEDQLAFFSSYNDRLRDAVGKAVVQPLEKIEARTLLIMDHLGVSEGESSIGDVIGPIDHPSQRLDVATLIMLHRSIMADQQGDAYSGRLRNVRVWVGGSREPTYIPPLPDEILDRLRDLLEWWRTAYPGLRTAARQTLAYELARLHHGLLAIHPFVDGNGRLARLIIDQVAHELADTRVSVDLVADRSAYFQALSVADGGDFRPLTALVDAAFA